jgi:hypothetical protein
MAKTIVGLDFDGTLVEHCYPEIGPDIGAFEWLEPIVPFADFVLFTMRSGDSLDEAVEYVKSKGIKLYGINVNPTQHSWTTSPKAYCHIYVDDAALGVPLKDSTTGRKCVDWEIAGPMLLDHLGI